MLDPTAHGGSIAWGYATVLIGGQPAARLGDPHLCPLADPKPHVGGVITQGSMTVYIGNAKAARLGDLCGCNTVGLSGMGVPPIAGPGAPPPPKLETDDAAADFPDWLPEWLRPDVWNPPEPVDPGPGVHDNEWEIAAKRIQSADGSESVDFLYAKGERQGPGVSNGVLDSLFNPLNMLGKTRLEVGLWKARGKDRKNGDGTADAEVNSVHAELERDLLIGSDGKRYGLGAGAKASAAWVDGKVAPERKSVPYLDSLLNDLGYSMQYQTEGGLTAGVGAGGGAHAFYDSETEEFHIGGFISALWAEGKGGLVIRALPEEQDEGDGGVKGMGGGGIPNTIILGHPTVLIGG